jgi:hypothetical protein
LLQGVIISAVLNAPGSWHDSHVAHPIFHQLLMKVPNGYFLVADTGFPCGTASIAGKIQAPVKEGEYIPEDPYEQEEFLWWNRQLLSYRQSAEWGNCMLQGSFGRLRVPLDINAECDRQELLELCCRLHNIRTELVGINQIRNVYMPVWKASEDEELWSNLGDMIFGDIRRRDRVLCFHLVAVPA